MASSLWASLTGKSSGSPGNNLSQIYGMNQARMNAMMRQQAFSNDSLKSMAREVRLPIITTVNTDKASIHEALVDWRDSWLRGVDL